jgi:hypothetical protein
MFREITSILSSGTNFQEHYIIAQRYLALENSSSSLYVFCLSGECPHRESVMRITLTSANNTLSATINGGKWQ